MYPSCTEASGEAARSRVAPFGHVGVYTAQSLSLACTSPLTRRREKQVPAGLRDIGHGMLPTMESYAPSFPGPVFDSQIALQSLLQRVDFLEAALKQALQPENLSTSADGFYPVAPQLSHLALAQNMYAGSRGFLVPPLLSAAGQTGPTHELANTLQTALTRAHLLALAHSVGLHESTPGLSAGHPGHASKASSNCEARRADIKELPSDKKPPVASEDGCTSDSSSSVSGKNSTPRPTARLAPARKQTGGHRSQWSAEEHQRFLAGLARFGPKDKGPACAKNGARVSVGLGPGVAEVIAVVVGTRNVSQVRSHAQKYFLRQTRVQSDGTQSNA